MLRRRRLDSGADDVRRQGGRFRRGLAAQHRPHEHRGEDVAGAVRHELKPRIEVVCDSPAVADRRSQQPGLEGNAGKHHVLRAQPVQAPDQLLHFRARAPDRTRGAAGEQRRLGYVGQDVGRPAHEPRDLRGEVRREAGIEDTVVGHRGVDEPHCARLRARPHDGKDRIDVAFADVAGVESVELDALVEPHRLYLRHLGREVEEGPRREAWRRVVGEYGGGQNGAFYAARANQGQRDRRGALPHAREVLYGKQPLHLVTRSA